MGMPGMNASDIAAYAQPKEAVSVKQSNSKMTVAELRNRANPLTKYYDFMSAKAFVEDPSISMEDKIAVVYGNYIANGARVAGLSEAMFNELKKVVE